MKMYVCTECGQPCDGHMVDFGNGPYEYQGQKGVDIDERFVSKCCDSVMIDNDGREVDTDPEVEEDYYGD